jgi:hypothetical protein
MPVFSRVVRCSSGHLFTIRPWPYNVGGKFGFGRFLYCPVGGHWASCKSAQLTEEDRRAFELGEARAKAEREALRKAEDERIKDVFRRPPGQPPS